MLVLPAKVQAQFTFTTNSGAITVTGYNPAAGLNVVIPRRDEWLSGDRHRNRCICLLVHHNQCHDSQQRHQHWR